MQYEYFSALMRQEMPDISEKMMRDQYAVYQQEQTLFLHFSKNISSAITCNDLIAETRLQLGKARVHGVRRAIGIIDKEVKTLQESSQDDTERAQIAPIITGMMHVREKIVELMDFDIRENFGSDTSNDNEE